MRRASAVVLLASFSCIDFDDAAREACIKNPTLCEDGGTGTGGGTAGGAAGGTAGGTGTGGGTAGGAAGGTAGGTGTGTGGTAGGTAGGIGGGAAGGSAGGTVAVDAGSAWVQIIGSASTALEVTGLAAHANRVAASGTFQFSAISLASGVTALLDGGYTSFLVEYSTDGGYLAHTLFGGTTSKGEVRTAYDSAGSHVVTFSVVQPGTLTFPPSQSLTIPTSDAIILRYSSLSPPVLIGAARFGPDSGTASQSASSAAVTVDPTNDRALVIGSYRGGGGSCTLPYTVATNWVDAAFDVDGGCAWRHNVSCTGPSYGERIAIAAGSVLVAGRLTVAGCTGPLGTISGGPQSVVFHYQASNGMPLWQSPLPLTAIYGLATGNGRVFVAGEFATTIDLGGRSFIPDGGKDLAIVELGLSTGSILNAWHYGGGGNEEVVRLDLDQGQRLHLSGVLSGSTLSFGGPVLSAAVATRDVFSVTLQPLGDGGMQHVRTLHWSSDGGQVAYRTHSAAIDPQGADLVGSAFTIGFTGPTSGVPYGGPDAQCQISRVAP